MDQADALYALSEWRAESVKKYLQRGRAALLRCMRGKATPLALDGGVG